MTEIPAGEILYQSSQIEQLDYLKDQDGEHVTGATVTVTVTTWPGGEEVENGTDIAMPYIEDTDSVYQGVLPADLGLEHGANYLVTVLAEFGGFEVRFRDIRRCVLIPGGGC